MDLRSMMLVNLFGGGVCTLAALIGNGPFECMFWFVCAIYLFAMARRFEVEANDGN